MRVNVARERERDRFRRDDCIFVMERIRKERRTKKRKQDENVIETNENERAIVLQWLVQVSRSIYRR